MMLKNIKENLNERTQVVESCKYVAHIKKNYKDDFYLNINYMYIMGGNFLLNII